MDPQQDIPFEKIGGYRILRRLATGGTSDVLLAKAEGPHGFERTVVLKLLLAHFRNEELMEKMFAREAAAYARLSHPAIVKLYDFFAAEGQLVMVLEYVDGIPLNKLRAMLKGTGELLDDRSSIFIASRVFAALAAAHNATDPDTGELAPVIHRDVNPSNVLIPWDGHVKLADFGIAKVAGIQGDTQAGFIKGTYGYMAPEQVKGEHVTVRADVYAASLLLWELLARRKAIQRGALPEMEVLRAMAEPSIVPLDVLRPDLPERLRNAVERGLEIEPERRTITADEMLAVLRDTVPSLEGRAVLVDVLTRARPGFNPQARKPLSAAPDVDAAFDAIMEQRPPMASDVNPLARTALGLGNVPAIAARVEAAPQVVIGGRAPGSARMKIEDRLPASERGERPLRREPTIRGISPVQPPPPYVDIERPAPATLPPPGMLGPPSLPPTFGATLSSRPPPALAIASPSAPMHVPLSTPPPPPPDTASFDPFPVSPMGTPNAPLYMTPAPEAPPESQPALDKRSQPTITSEARKRRGLMWALVAGLALLGSGAVVAGLMLSPKNARKGGGAPQGSLSAVPPHPVPSASAPPKASASAAASAGSARPQASAAPGLPTWSSPVSSVTASASASSKPAVSAAPSASAPATASGAASAATGTASPPGYGEVRSPASSAGHRIFVDDKVVGTAPDPVRVRCGSHSIRIGSHGVARTVDVPCGGAVSITEK